MSDSHSTRHVSLGHVPDHQRHRILSGMRWSVWLSLLAVPFGAATNLILARVGPETIGVYGLLSIYIGLVTSFVYLGGDTVVIRFIPECKPQDRSPFICSYLLLIAAMTIFWLIFVYFCPAAMRLVLGKSTGDGFHFLVLCLAPLPIGFSMIAASLKGILDFRFSLTLAKLLPIISFFVLGAIFLVARPLLANSPAAAIWCVYLGLMAVFAIIGAFRLVRLCGRPQLRLYLPPGFWRYAFATQQVSVVSFLVYRVDYLLVLNFGGVSALGRYVAIMTVAASIPLISTFFMDTLLASLINMLAARNHAGAAQVFMMHMRVLFLVVTAVSCAIMVLAVPVTWLMGPKYLSLRSLIILMTIFQGIACPGLYGGALLASVSRQELAARVGVLHLCLFAALFLIGWHQWNLAGAVAASGLALVASNTLLMAIGLRTARIYPSIFGLWLKAVAALVMVGVAALRWMPLGLTSAVLTWLLAMGLFLLLGRYGKSEFMSLAHTFLPDSPWRQRGQTGAVGPAAIAPESCVSLVSNVE